MEHGSVFALPDAVERLDVKLARSPGNFKNHEAVSLASLVKTA
jgi:hypothetical protein